jgi:hypothetical protein
MANKAFREVSAKKPLFKQYEEKFQQDFVAVDLAE